MLSSSSLLPKGWKKEQVLYRKQAAHIVFQHSGHGLAGMVVLGRALDLKILEVFSNLNDSMIT